MDNLRKSFLVRGNSIVGAVGDKYFSSTAIGVIQAFSGNIIPRGFLACDGASYKVADYPDLYGVIGNTYGGDTENFNVPTVQPPALTMVYIIKAFHTNEGVDSGVSDDVINYVNNLNSYSTEETLTGGKWINGKPIYRKVCVFKISEESNTYDLSDLNFDECWITNGFVKQTNGTVNYPMNFFRNSADDVNSAWIRLELKQLVVQVTNLEWFNNNAYVIIEYTKTTDA